MKHKITITTIILCMFLLAQFIGLYVILSNSVPSYLSPVVEGQEQSYGYYFYQIVSSIIVAILIVVLITKYKLKFFMKAWFFLVIAMALSISLFAFSKNLFGITNYLVPLILAIILAAIKIYRPSVIIHNGTELLIYPGIAAIFVQILNPLYIILLLILISIYDMWAVWHSGIMQKMAKFQMNELKIFGGFFIPYLTKEIRQKMQAMKKSKKKKPLRISLAILGGGDVVFPIITAGVFMNSYGLGSAMGVIFGALAGLAYLLFRSEKKKFYPAMPFITVGIFLGLLIWFLLRII